jgi:hypothetical protein
MREIIERKGWGGLWRGSIINMIRGSCLTAT